MSTENSLYFRVEGGSFFVRLVEAFYSLVVDDPILRPLYPADLGPGKAHLAAFLAQYWGGPPYYSMERGHPRLKMRHFRFPIGQLERDTWVRHMRTAVELSEASTADMTMLIEYFEQTATFIMNKH